ncbi:MAG: hypothetical protein PVF96_07615, partial [Candidatus Bathyarchaeota archaeon]
WKNMPYNPDDHISWPSEDAWKEAAGFRGNDTGMIYIWTNTDQGVSDLKEWLASGHLAVLGVDAEQYPSLTSDDVWTLDTYVNPSLDHANTVVGYNDSFAYFESGETRYGAFKIANSWGVGVWENIPDGCFWISYETMKQRVLNCKAFLDLTDYAPELVASFQVDHTKRSECGVTIGLGNESDPISVKSVSGYWKGGSHPFCPNKIFIDITEFKKSLPVIGNNSFFLKVYDGGTSETGTIESFALEYSQSLNTPLNTVNGDFVYAKVAFNPLETFWTNTLLVVRGLNDKVFYRTYNCTESKWMNWSYIQSGATCDSPTAVAYLGKLYTVVRGMDGRSLWFGWTNLTDNAFSGWTRISGATKTAPTFIRHYSRLILIVRGLNNRIFYRMYDCISGEWEDWSSIQNGVTCDGPSAGIIGDKLHIVVRGYSDSHIYANNSLWHGYLDLSTEIFSGWTRLKGITPSRPALVASKRTGKLYLVVRGLSNSLYYNVFNDTNWRGWSFIPGSTIDGPCVTITGSKLQLVVRGYDGNTLWYGYLDLVTEEFIEWTNLSGSTASAPTLSHTEKSLFEEDFLEITSWTISSGTWEINDNNLEGYGFGEGLIFVNYTELSNYVLMIRLRIFSDSTEKEAAVTTRLRNDNNYYWLGLGCWQHKVSISKMNNDIPSELAFEGVRDDIVSDNWYDLTITCIDDELRLYVDNVPELEVSDSDPSSHIGSIGIRLYNSHIEIDYVRLIE